MPQPQRQIWRDSLKKHGGEFARGLFRPSLAGAIGAILVAAAWFGICMWRITPRFVAHYGGYLMRDNVDNYAHLTSEALKLAVDTPRDPVCVVIGDSMIREAITNEADLTRRVCEKAGRNIWVCLLVADGMTQWEAVSITDVIRGRVRGVVAIEITPGNVSIRRGTIKDRAQNPRLAIDSPAERDEIRRARWDAPRRFHNYFLNHYAFFSIRTEAVANLLNGPQHPPEHELDNLPTWSPGQWRKNEARITGWRDGYEEFHKGNFALYQRMIARLKQSGGIAVVLVEGTLNPRMETLGIANGRDPMLDKYRADIARFAAENGVEDWDLVRIAGLQNKDFLDYGHLRDWQARQRFTEALAGKFVEALKKGNLMENQQ